MSLDSQHPEYTDSLSRWKKMRDCYDGQEAVKAAGITYLPCTKGHRLDGMGANQQGLEDYNAYKERAVFHDLVQVAVETLIGILNSKPPVVEVPTKMQSLLSKVNPDGESITGLLRRIHEEQLVPGRCGLIADMPKVPDQTNPLPYIDLYKAEAVINWDNNMMGDGEVELNLVVVKETGKKRGENFTWQDATNYRILELDAGGVYQQGLFEDGSAYSADALRTPVHKGRPLRELPFVFINPKDCLPTVDRSPLLGLADLALAIYRLEADYRQCLFMQGQDTLVIMGGLRKSGNGLDGTEEGVRVGAGALIEIDIGGDAKYIGVQSTGLPELRSALENDKQQAAVKTGQLLAPGKSSLESGEALKTRVAAQTATLTQIAETSGSALEKMLKVIARWTGEDESKVKVIPNTDFTNWTIQGQDLVQLITAKRLGAPISAASIHQVLKERGLTKMEYDAEIALLKDDAMFIKLVSEFGTSDSGNNPTQVAGGGRKSTEGQKPRTNEPTK